MAANLTTPEEQASFFTSCVKKKRSIRDICELLELFSGTNHGSKGLHFHQGVANNLHKRIMQVAKDFKRFRWNSSEHLVAEIDKEEIFSNEIDELGNCYGNDIWGEAHRTYGQLDWTRGADQRK